MEHNISSTDRVIRFIGGLLLIVLGLLAITNNVVQVIALVLGVIAVVESFVGYCYLYRLLGINTCKDRRKLWGVLGWIFALCGIAAYLTGWIALLNNADYWVSTEFWFYDAITAGIFAIFFRGYAHNPEDKKRR